MASTATEATKDAKKCVQSENGGGYRLWMF